MKVRIGLLFAACFFFSGHAASAPEDDVKALFERFVAAQNAHDANAVRELLVDSPNFLWISRGITIWGRDAAIKRFETLYQGTWRLALDSSTVKIFMLSETAAQLYASIMFTTGAPGQPPPRRADERDLRQDSRGLACGQHSSDIIAAARASASEVRSA